MPLFKTIQAEEDLPLEGAGAERVSFDLKGGPYPRPFKHEEMAKDVAAFANASGGVVLVGAYEDRTRGVLGRYGPMTDTDANEQKAQVSIAVRNLCSPAPFVDVAVVGKNGGFVVAVNVWPFAGQAVGVRLPQTDSYSFPLRTAVDTVFIQPEQLAMLMVPEVRRVVILLSEMKVGDRVEVVYKKSKGGTDRAPFSFLELRERDNVIILKWTQKKEMPETSLPIDQIKTVWRESPGEWSMGVAGELAFVIDLYKYTPG